MKNVPIYYARTLIIARIAATIIPTPIDFNNLIIIMRVLSPGSALPSHMFVYEFYSIPQRKAKSHKQRANNIVF